MILFLVEFTTMAGRRLRDAVKTVLTSKGHGKFDSNVHIVIAGLTNTYSQPPLRNTECKDMRFVSPTSLLPC